MIPSVPAFAPDWRAILVFLGGDPRSEFRADQFTPTTCCSRESGHGYFKGN
jgi:hypothetical protein